MPNEVKKIIKNASTKEDKIKILESIDICISVQKALRDRIKKLLTTLVIN